MKTNWKKVKIGEILSESKNESYNSDSSKRITVRLNVKGVEKRLDANEKAGATKQYIRNAGQFIYGRQNLHKGAFGIVPPELDGYESSADIPAFDISNQCLAEWIFYYFKSGNRYLELDKLAVGVGSRRISPQKFLDLEIPLPSLEEQKDIIDKVHAREDKLGKFSSINNFQLSILTSLRQQILQDAITGKLSKKWREESSNVESAELFLKKINSVKIQLINEGKIRKQKSIPLIAEDDMPVKLPESWIWCRLQDVLKTIQYGTSTKCTTEKYEDKTAVLRIPNVSSGEIDLSDLKYAELSNKEKAELDLKKGDLLVIRSNGSKDIVGQATLVRQDLKNFSYAGYLIRIRTYIDPEYLLLCFRSNMLRKQIETPLRTTVGINNINSTELSSLLIPLPPLEEQGKIIKLTESLLSKLDRLKALNGQTKETTDLLNQVIHKEIFDNN